IKGWAENGLYELNARNQTISIGEYRLIETDVKITNIRGGKVVEPYTTVTGNVEIAGLKVKVSGEVRADGYYKLQATAAITPIPGFTFAKDKVSLEKGVGLHYVGGWDLGQLHADLDVRISGAGTVKF